MALKVDIYTKNMEAGERVTEYINKKVSKLERFLNDIEETRVDLSYLKSARSSSDRHVAQITIRGKGFILRSEERSDDIFAAIDTTMDKVERQIERFKGKRARGRGDGASAADVAPDTITTEEVETGQIIARRKQFTLPPMDEMEALEQMNCR